MRHVTTLTLANTQHCKIAYLEQLVRLKMLISIDTNILDIVFHYLVGLGSHVIIFRVDISSFIHANNKKKDILILGKGPTQGLEHTLATKKMHSINFTEDNKHSCLSLHYNEANSYLFANGKEIQKFKAKDSEIVATPLCTGNISKDWSVDNMKKTGLNGYVYYFCVDYSDTAVHDILDIQNYLMKRKYIVQKNVWIFQANIYFRNVNSKQPVYFPFSIKTSKCSGGCNKSMMHMKNCVFLMLLKILISEHSI